jgi:hypothetical protein
MDPRATMAALLSALADRDSDAAAEHAENLAAWIKRGGFMPLELSAIAGNRADCLAYLASLTD